MWRQIENNMPNNGKSYLAEDDRRVTQAIKALIGIDGWLAKLNEFARSGAESQESWIARSLLDSTRIAFRHLHKGWQSDVTYTAWACRSLIELRVFSTYVVQSEANRRRFIDDLAVDSVDSNRALVKFIETVDTMSMVDAADIADLKNADIALQNSAYEVPKTFLKPMTLATELGLGADYSAIYKMCSKLVHPTAQSVLLMHKDMQAERDMFVLMGGNCLHDIMDDLCPFIEKLDR